MNPLTLACVRLHSPPTSPKQATAIVALLQQFTPQVAPEPGRQDVYYLNAQGLLGLYQDYHAWAQAILLALQHIQVTASVCVGYGRFTTFVLTHGDQQVWVAQSGPQEQAVAYGMPLDRLPIGPKLLEVIWELGLTTLGPLIALPRAEVAMRLGKEAAALQHWAQEGNFLPLACADHPVACLRQAAIEPADSDVHRLLFVCKGLLVQLAAHAQAERSELAALHVTLVLEGPGALCPKPPERLTRTIEAGRPGRDQAPWLELLRLALDAWSLPGPVQAVHIAADLVATRIEQLSLWPTAHARDPTLTTTALAQLHALLGAEAVTCARLEDAHRPEARFSYRPVRQLAPLARSQAWAQQGPKPGRPVGTPMLMRQLFAIPRPLGARLHPQTLRAAIASCAQPQGLHLALPPKEGPIGPYRYSGGWWLTPCDRDYYYLPKPDGAWLWAYFDRQTRQWLLQGVVD